MPPVLTTVLTVVLGALLAVGTAFGLVKTVGAQDTTPIQPPLVQYGTR